MVNSTKTFICSFERHDMLLHVFFNRWRCGIYIHDTWLIYGEHMKKRRGLILSAIKEITGSKMRDRRMTLFTDFHFTFT